MNMNFVRGAVLAIFGGAAGLAVGYNTRPYTESSVFLTQGQANEAVQAVGIHMLIAIAVGFAAGLAVHFLMPRPISKP